jgi:hypothetical protein
MAKPGTKTYSKWVKARAQNPQFTSGKADYRQLLNHFGEKH